MSIEKIQSEDRRLVILRTLANSMRYTANESLIDKMLEAYGHYVGRDVVRTELAWLKDQGLVTIEEPGGIMIAEATRRGVEAARGESTVPGVSRPSAGE